MNLVEELLRTLGWFRHEACPEVHHLPSIYDVHVMLLCGSLNCSDLFVSDHFTDVVVRDVSEVAFSNKKACIWCNRVYVLLKLLRIINFHTLRPHSRGRVPIPKYPARWGHLTMP